ncbi:MAG: TetR family transcriptional regulator [Phyllobacteriaceae bacterium]|jgi:AcrR family transcriptional regulator|nr:TetR family transcriptional regulator [Phyllobacteriaceae bacterium]
MVEIRKRPVQARSQARFAQILDAAKALIARYGSDGLKMSDIAKDAGVPIGTVYQFFPNKSAVIETLVRDCMADIRAGLAAQFDRIAAKEDVPGIIEAALRQYRAVLKADPVMRDVLTATQGDKKLKALDVADSRENGDLLVGRLAPLVAEDRREDARAVCFLNMHLAGALVRLIADLDDATAERMIEQFMVGVRQQLRVLMGDVA